MQFKTVVAGAWSAVAVAALTSFVPTPSSACTLSLDGPQQTSVTADGTLLFAFSCTPGIAPCAAGQTPPFHVEDDAGHTLTGSVVKSGVLATGLWIAWKPEQAFAQNVNYRLKGDLDGFDNEVVLDAHTSPAFDPTTLQMSFSAEKSAIPAGMMFCCELSTHIVDCGAERPSCFPAQRQEVVALGAHATGSVQPSTFQHLYRITFRADGTSITLPDQLAPEVDYPVQTPAHAYCYSIDAVHPLTNALVHVSDGCKTLDITTLGLRDATNDEHRQDLIGCANVFLDASVPAPIPDASVHDLGPDAAVPASLLDASVSTGIHQTGVREDGGMVPSGKPTPSDDGGCAVSRRFDLGYALALLVLALRARKKQHA